MSLSIPPSERRARPASVSATQKLSGLTCARDSSKARALLVETGLAALLVMLVGLAYGNALSNGFCFDDVPFIQLSDDVGGIDDIPGLFGFGRPMAYRPVRQASYAIDGELWGKNPFGYHLTNIVLHAIATVLVYCVSRRLFRRRAFSWVVAALFALHPIHTESVTYISGRKDVLCTLFGLVAMMLALRLRDRWSQQSITLRGLHGLGILFALLLSIGSKEMGFAFLPLLVVGGLLLRLRDSSDETSFRSVIRDARAILRRHRGAFFIAAGLMIGVAVFLFVKGRATHASWHGGDIVTNFLNVARVQVLYLYRLLVPLRLIGDYHFDTFRVTTSWFDPVAYVCGAGLLALIGVAVVNVRRRFVLVFGVIVYFVAMLPVMHIRPHHELLAERFLYLPSIGFCIAFAAMLGTVAKRIPRRVAVAGLVLILAAYGGRTALRNLDWRDDFTFWSVTREQSPRNARAHVYYAYNVYYSGRTGEAIQAMERALEIMPTFATGQYNLGRMYESIGGYEKAIEAYRKEIARYFNADAYFNLANIYGKLGRYADAEKTFRTLLDKTKPTADVLYYLGVVCEKQGRITEARQAFRRAEARDENDPRVKEALRRLRLRGDP